MARDTVTGIYCALRHFYFRISLALFKDCLKVSLHSNLNHTLVSIFSIHSTSLKWIAKIVEEYKIFTTSPYFDTDYLS